MSLEVVNPQPSRDDAFSSAPEHYEHSSLQVNEALHDSQSMIKQEPITENYYDAEHQHQGRPDDRQNLYRLPFGCTPLLFGVVTALITAVIVGAAVGGGVGASLGGSGSEYKSTSVPGSASIAPLNLATTTILSCSSSAPSSASALATSYTPLPSTSISSLARDCPSLENTTYSTTLSNQEWTLLCDVRYTGFDIVSIFAYTWQDCIDACAGVNYYASTAAGGVEGGEQTCQHAMFQARTDAAYNCWCKYKGATVGPSDPARMLLSADLVL